MAKNIPSFQLNQTSVTARNAEYAGTPLTDTVGDGTTANPYLGCNAAGSCAPGIGINTGEIFAFNGEAARPETWTELDQAGAGRTPQDSQHIGGDGLGDGDATVNPLTYVQGADINNTANFVECDAAVAPDGICDTVTGAVNKSSQTTAVGDLIWGVVPVA
jgi:hypothetical protein